jgi:glycyl-tRNA synthetase beta chain
MPERRAELLLEVGCEEIPASWLPALTDELRERFVELAAAEHLEPEDTEAHSTPRRLVLRADLLARQPDREEEVWGPALKSAKDASGQWTRAALGFASKQGIAAMRSRPAPSRARGTRRTCCSGSARRDARPETCCRR